MLAMWFLLVCLVVDHKVDTDTEVGEGGGGAEL